MSLFCDKGMHFGRKLHYFQGTSTHEITVHCCPCSRNSITFSRSFSIHTASATDTYTRCGLITIPDRQHKERMGSFSRIVFINNNKICQSHQGARRTGARAKVIHHLIWISGKNIAGNRNIYLDFPGVNLFPFLFSFPHRQSILRMKNFCLIRFEIMSGHF